MKSAVRYFILSVVLGLLAGCQSTQLTAVNVFVTADIEGFFWSRPEPRYANEITGGFSILKSFLEQQTSPFLLLEGGNWFSQTPEGMLSQGAYFNTAADGIPYAGRMFTEKDLMYGWGPLTHLLKDSAAPFIVSNVTMRNGKLPAGMKPWLLKEVDGYKIGVLGVLGRGVLQEKQRTSGMEVLPETESVRQTVELLRKKGAQAIIVLSGLTVSGQEKGLTSADLAQEVQGIDVIISANTGQEDAQTVQVGKTLLVGVGSRLDSVGHIQLFFTKKGEVAESRFEDIVLYKRDFGEDETTAQAVAALRQKAQRQLSRPAGQSGAVLEGDLNGESVLGDWAADCLRKWAKTEVAVLNAAALRDTLPQGTVTEYDIYKIYPYTDHVTYLTMKGKALWQALESSLSVADNFAQVSGLKIRYNPNAEKGKKISAVWVQGYPLSKSASYRVAVTDHMLAGGAGHDGFIDSLEFKNTQVDMRTVLRLCMSSKKVTAPTAGRWSVQK